MRPLYIFDLDGTLALTEHRQHILDNKDDPRRWDKFFAACVEEGPNKWIVQNVMQLISAFAEQGHSGSSAPYVAGVFHKLANYEPLCPLTGEADEWNWVGPDMFQNNRCSHVFKEHGKAYDSEGRIFREADGTCYQNSDSRVFIEFPYTPKRVYVNRPT